MQQQYQWFPGHMAKALKEIEARMKVIDIVLELVDARTPFASHNPSLKRIVKTKPLITILTKKDLADDKYTAQWLKYYRDNNKYALAIDLAKNDLKGIERMAKEILKDKLAKEKAKGLRERSLRYLVVGIPNVGKSTLINKLSKRKVANVANKPGVTKAQQYIKVSESMELLDTPGVLWPNFEDKTIGVKLAMIGTIKQEILPLDDMLLQILNFLTTKYPKALDDFYGVELPLVIDGETVSEALAKIAIKRGFRLKEGKLDYNRTTEAIIKDFQNGKIARVSIETPGEDTWQIVNLKMN